MPLLVSFQLSKKFILVTFWGSKHYNDFWMKLSFSAFPKSITLIFSIIKNVHYYNWWKLLICWIIFQASWWPWRFCGLGITSSFLGLLHSLAFVAWLTSSYWCYKTFFTFSPLVGKDKLGKCLYPSLTLTSE